MQGMHAKQHKQFPAFAVIRVGFILDLFTCRAVDSTVGSQVHMWKDLKAGIFVSSAGLTQ
jgi:hypothetical protein